MAKLGLDYLTNKISLQPNQKKTENKMNLNVVGMYLNMLL
jgi:hypothetical protein